MRRKIFIAAALLAASCVSYESEYERAVYDDEPVYCYRTIGAVDCYRKPNARDHRQLVNYYGPAPGKYRRPAPAPVTEPQAPPEIETFSRAPDSNPADPAAETAVNSPTAGPSHSPSGGAPASASQTSARSTVAAGSAEKEDDWRSWLPVVSVLFGAAQAVAVFMF